MAENTVYKTGKKHAYNPNKFEHDTPEAREDEMHGPGVEPNRPAGGDDSDKEHGPGIGM